MLGGSHGNPSRFDLHVSASIAGHAWNRLARHWQHFGAVRLERSYTEKIDRTPCFAETQGSCACVPHPHPLVAPAAPVVQIIVQRLYKLYRPCYTFSVAAGFSSIIRRRVQCLVYNDLGLGIIFMVCHSTEFPCA